MRLARYVFACFLLAGSVFLPVSGQEYFGKNKVSLGDFDWHFIETEHFTIYFDKNSLPVAEFAAKEAERSLREIEEGLNYEMKGRYPLVFYNSHNGFAVSNISGSELTEFTGGFTEFAQGRVVIPYTGSYADFRHVIHHELVHSVTVELWTGGGWLGAMLNQQATIPPLWVVEGIAEYLSRRGWDIAADNQMRDATITGYVPPIEFIPQGGLFAYKGGQSIFYMIEQEYGREKVGQIIRDVRTAKTIDKALKSALGIGVEELNEKWHIWLKRQHWNEINKHDSPGEIAKALTDRDLEGGFFNLAPQFSPQGDKIAYLGDRNTTFDIYLKSAIDGKDLGRLVEGEKSSDFEWMFVLRPGITWSPDGRYIAFAAKSKNKNTLYTLDVKRRRIKKRFNFDLDGLFEPAWSPDGKQIAFSGLKNGWSDIYVVDLDTDDLHRITNDPYDETNLQWSPDGEWIAMSSDHPAESLDFSGQKDFEFGQYDIFVIRPDGSEVRRVVENEAKESYPRWGPDGKRIAYISDRTGVGNIYITEIDGDSEDQAVTNLLASALDFDWSPDGKKMAFTVFHKGGYDIFTLKNPLDKLKDPASLPLTRIVKRKKGLEDKTFVEIQRERSQSEQDSIASAQEDELDVAMEEDAASLTEDTAVDEEGSSQKLEQWVSDQVALAAEEEEETVSGSDSLSSGSDSSAVEDTNVASLDDWEREFKVKKYKVQFKPEIFAANAGFDTFYGVSGLAQFSLSDVMGDHRLSLLTSLNFSIEDSDFYLTYAYLKRQTNYFSTLFHTRLFFFSGNQLFADRYYGVSSALDRPFNRFSRLETSLRFITIQRDAFPNSLNPFVGGGFFGGPTQNNTGTTIRTDRAAIPQLALVDDNTRPGFFGPVSGRRARIDVEGSPTGLEFFTVSGDYRKYMRVLDQYTFAVRLAGGTSWGRNRTRFFVGGVNNTVNPTFSTIASVPTQEVFFSSFVWPLRGVELFETAGDSYVLTNIAFRFPLFHQIAMGWPLPFFFQNVQGELFLDVGAAFDRGDFDPWEARDGGFELRDLEGGYGFGARVNMGFFIFRYDIAWPTDFAQSSHPLQYFSIDVNGLF
jgi:hypothetical protein